MVVARAISPAAWSLAGGVFVLFVSLFIKEQADVSALEALSRANHEEYADKFLHLGNEIDRRSSQRDLEVAKIGERLDKLVDELATVGSAQASLKSTSDANHESLSALREAMTQARAERLVNEETLNRRINDLGDAVTKRNDQIDLRVTEIQRQMSVVESKQDESSPHPPSHPQ
jgi:predicted  nucleic acid-binding Zn-ribbon protein